MSPKCQQRTLLNDTLETTPTGRLMFNMLGAIAQFERELIRERMLVGIAKAKAEGKYKGRAPTARAKADKVKQLRAAGIGPSEIARQLSISRTSVFLPAHGKHGGWDAALLINLDPRN